MIGTTLPVCRCHEASITQREDSPMLVTHLSSCDAAAHP
jgi:hypothetical protein